MAVLHSTSSGQRSRVVLFSLLLLAALTGCGDDDSDPVNERLTVEGDFLDSHGAPLVGAPVDIFVLDSATENTIVTRTVSTDASGHYSSTFSWSPGTFPVYVQVRGWPPLGSGMSLAHEGAAAALPPGQAAVTQTFDLTTTLVDEPVNDVPPSPFAQSALLGHYSGQSVAPLAYDLIVYLDLDVTGTAGSVSGRFHVDYNATTASPPGTILGAVLLDTLRLQLTSDTIPNEPRHTASLKAIATSPTADTLIATPDPCSADCWLSVSPIRLIRTP